MQTPLSIATGSSVGRPFTVAYPLETVEQCFKECLRGANREKTHPIEEADLRQALSAAPHVVTELMRALLRERIGDIAMDEGGETLLPTFSRKTQIPFSFAVLTTHW